MESAGRMAILKLLMSGAAGQMVLDERSRSLLARAGGGRATSQS